ncbi:MAG: PAS domain S-box protein [Methanoculleus sp.]
MHTITSPDHILYVDDEEALLDIGRAFLERAGGIAVDITASPLEALRMILAGGYDAVVSDYQMPEMNGIALLQRVREAGSRVPFIIFTGRGREEVAIEALNSGADFYIQKGGNPKAQFAELANAVRQLAGRRRAEAAFHKSEEMLHKAESLAHLGSWEFDPRTGRLDWTDEVYRIFGLDPGKQTPTYEAFLAMVHPDDQIRFDTTFFASIADGKDGYEVEHRILRGDTGEIRYLVERCEHVRGESGEIVRSIGMVHDVTDRKLAELKLLRGHDELQTAYEQLTAIEEELRTSFDDLAESQHHLKESEERYRRLAENAEDIIYRVEFLPEMRFAYVNPAVTRIIGYTPEECYADAHLAERIVHPDDRSLIASLDRSSATERPITLRWVRKDRGVIWVELRNIPIFDSEGRIIALEGIGRDVTEAKRAEERLLESEGHVRKRLESILSPRGDIGSLELADIIDVPVIQPLIDDFHALVKIPAAIIDTRGRVLVGAGWQEICTKYHRAHPDTCRHCMESDTTLSAGVPAGESRMYRCRNNLWDIATPIIVGDRHLGNVYTGQFFFEDEEPDYEIFRSQARQYGFDEVGYLAALKAVPRLDRAFVDAAMAFLRGFAGLISRLSYSNITLARSLTERDVLMRSLRETADRLARAQEVTHIGSWEFDHGTGRSVWSDEVYRIFGLELGKSTLTREAFLAVVHPDDRTLVDTAYSTSIADGKDAYEVEHRILRGDTGEIRYLVERCEHARDESGEIVRSIGMVHDITDRKLAGLELRTRHDELQAAYEQLASIEEELRTSFDDLAENQQHLKESEERYRRISESISDVVYSCALEDTGEYVIDWIAGAVHEITGYTDEEILAMRCWKAVVHPDDLLVFEREIFWLSPGMSSLFELRIVRRDGPVRWLRVSANCTDSGSGHMRLYGGWQDITDQKEAEEALRESELHFRTLADHGQALIWRSGPDGMCDYFNEPWLAFTGRTLEQESGEGWVEGVHPDDRSRCTEISAGAFARHEPFSMILRLRRHDGEYRWIQDDGSPWYDTHGNFCGYIGHCLDVTRQRLAEEEVREIAEKTESIFRAAPTGIGMAVDGVVTEVNGRLCDIVGYTRDELIGRPVRLFYPDDAESESALQEMGSQIEKTGTCTLETRSMRKDGVIIDVLLSSTPLDPADISRGVTFTVLDISERKSMEREVEYHAGELALQTNGLAVANRKLNLMSSITRHDILNQLTILLGNLWMVEEAEPGEDVSGYLARAKSSADRIRRQIEFTRDYTDLGVRSPEWQRVSDVLRPEALHGLPIENEAGDLAIYADPMLATVFSNLMDNTIRHGESATRVRVRYRPEESGDLTLTWEDDGAGVPVGEKERIFHRGVGKNTGLGLFLIREILGITGISITETGEPGNGARFEMLVPRGMYRV